MTKDQYFSESLSIGEAVRRWAGPYWENRAGVPTWRRSPTGDEELDAILLRVIRAHWDFEYQEAVRQSETRRLVSESRRLMRKLVVSAGPSLRSVVSRGRLPMLGR